MAEWILNRCVSDFGGTKNTPLYSMNVSLHLLISMLVSTTSFTFGSSCTCKTTVSSFLASSPSLTSPPHHLLNHKPFWHQYISTTIIGFVFVTIISFFVVTTIINNFGFTIIAITIILALALLSLPLLSLALPIPPSALLLPLPLLAMSLSPPSLALSLPSLASLSLPSVLLPPLSLALFFQYLPHPFWH